MKKFGVLILTIISVCLAAYLEAFLEIAHRYEYGELSGFITFAPQVEQVIRLFGIFLVILFIGIVLWKYHGSFLHFVYKYRYLVALILLALCVLFEISGSSIDCVGKSIGSTESGVIFGIPRYVRSDEYALFTPFSFSQYYNAAGKYPYFSQTIRGALTDTFIVYGQPSWDIATIFRPFLWGHLLFGPAKGLSFFWVARLLALFLISFEFALIYTRKDKWLSMAAAALISFAPIVQWWFAINGLVEMLVFGQVALLCVYHYLRTRKTGCRIVTSILFFWSAGVYILTLYPAWQIPLLYGFAALLIYVLTENWKTFTFRWKRDLPIWGAGILLLTAVLLHVWFKSADAIHIVRNTVYPGNRISTGGGGFLWFFKYGASMFLPLIERNLNTNPPEASAFFDFFPLGIFLAFYVLFAEKKRDSMLISLLVAQAILFIYTVFGLPEFFAKITFLSYTTSYRTILATGLINVFLLLRSLAVVEWKPKISVAVAASLVLSIPAGLLCRRATGNYIGSILIPVLFAMLLIGFCLTLLVLKNILWKKVFVLFCILIVAVSGGLVNPIQSGVDVIYKNELVQSIRQIAEQDQGLWLVEGSYPMTNVPIMVGAPTINSTNVYPNLERWRLLDPAGQYEEVYNRYAHINADLTDEATQFDLVNADFFALKLNFADLRLLNVTYLLTSKDYRSAHIPDVNFSLLAQVNGYSIYRLTYPK